MAASSGDNDLVAETFRREAVVAASCQAARKIAV